MQTFLPVPNFIETVKILDYKRLGKQRVECLQILNSCQSKLNGWRNHPAVKMWIGYEVALKLYMNFCIKEWIDRGYKNSIALNKVDHLVVEYPWWFGDDQFHASHRAALLYKDYEYYEKFGWMETPEINYRWPV